MPKAFVYGSHKTLNIKVTCKTPVSLSLLKKSCDVSSHGNTSKSHNQTAVSWSLLLKINTLYARIQVKIRFS